MRTEASTLNPPEPYVTVLAGTGSAIFLIAGALLPAEAVPTNGRVYTFRLGGSAPVPPVEREVEPTPEPPEVAVAPAQLRQAATLYGRFCAACHGVGAVAGGALPDLRRSEALQSAEDWRDMVLGGSRVRRGMTEFDGDLTPASVELLRAYVSRQAALPYAAEQAGR